MKLLLFSTHRQIRNWLSNFNNTILDKHRTIGDFFNEIIVVKDKKFVDNNIRKIYLFEAIKKIDISLLGFNKEFLSFTKNSDFLFSFFREIFLENVDIDEIVLADVYLDYEEHLKLLKHIRLEYKNILEENGYIDTFLINEYEINEKLLDNIEEIEIYLDGYLSKFELEILQKIDKSIKILFDVSKFNKPLISKMFEDLEVGYRYIYDFKKMAVIKQTETKINNNIEISYFSKRFDQINFVFAKIAEFIEQGFDPNKIAVVLPDEKFSEFLEEFDEFKNLNFAMGESFIHSNLYIKLKAIYEFLLNQDEISRLKITDWIEEFEKNEDILEFIRLKASNKELQVIDEELFKIAVFKDLFETKQDFLYFILERFKEFSFDDIYSGKITVMGVLESRSMQYDGVILIDFNEGIVPNVNDKDLFLNTAIRINSKLPTRMDKENLQKHYYFSLINSSKQVAISYVQNEKESASRFLYELGLELGKNKDTVYNEVLYNISDKKNKVFYEEKFEIKEPITPSSLKMILECPQKYYFYKILAITNELEDEENFGNVFHSVLEKVVLNKDNINSKEEYFEEIMNGIYVRLNSKKDIYEIRVKYEDSIKKFAYMDYENMKYSNQIIEKFLDVDFIKKLTSKVDRVDITTTTITLIDYKTGKLDSLLKHPYEFQLTFYYLWAKYKFPDKKIKVGYWDILNGEFIDQSPKIEELKDVLNNLPNKVKMAEDIIINDKVIKKQSDICKWCDYKVACQRD